jgi:hypothetical protein
MARGAVVVALLANQAMNGFECVRECDVKGCSAQLDYTTGKIVRAPHTLSVRQGEHTNVPHPRCW